MTAKYDRRDPSDDPATDPGRAERSRPDHKYRCSVCQVRFDLPGMTKHFNETQHPITFRGSLVDMTQDMFMAEYGMPRR